MFFKLVMNNSRRSRKENGLLFASLILSIIAFYIILSLPKQDVMIFLQKMESDAVSKLMLMIPVFFAMSLFLLFFLIYYASKYQMERRRHEFGVYQMMGMHRVKLFGMLLVEDLGNSVLALVIGLPVAILISELTSLVTAKIVGLGIIRHQFSLSVNAILWTVIGFLLIKLAAFLILSGKISRRQIGELLADMPENSKKQVSRPAGIAALVLGIATLGIACVLATQGVSWENNAKLALTLFLGILGTFLLFAGLRIPIGKIAQKDTKHRRLHAFQFRQIEETVVAKSGTMAICSLLFLAALCCFGSGVSVAYSSGAAGEHLLDYTFSDAGDSSLTTANVTAQLQKAGAADYFSDISEVKIGMDQRSKDYDNAYQMDALLQGIREQPASEERDTLLNNLSYDKYPYLISLSSYNHLRELAGEPAVKLAQNQAAVFIHPEFFSEEGRSILNEVLKKQPWTRLDQKKIQLTGETQSINLVTDRSITISFALILPDEQFAWFTKGDYTTYVNGVLKASYTKQYGLMEAIAQMNEKLDQTDLDYESYLQNMGRKLFYRVSASYLTIYLSIIFLLIANTMIGVQFLMSQQKTGRRYRTLIRLGASYELLCQSANGQIQWYFGLPVVVAAITSIFGVRAIFQILLSASVSSSMLVCAAMILVLCVIEWIYISVVKRASSRYLLTLMAPRREE